MTEIPLSTDGDQSRVVIVTDDLNNEGGFNVYWLLFILGFFFTPIFCLIGSFGLCSKRRGERLAGKVNLIGFFLGLVLIVVLVIAYLKFISDIVDSITDLAADEEEAH